jgi:hypothetical protein
LNHDPPDLCLSSEPSVPGFLFFKVCIMHYAHERIMLLNVMTSSSIQFPANNIISFFL